MEPIKFSFFLGDLEVSLTEDSRNRKKLRRPVESEINSFLFLPKLQFQNLDSILKTQLYEISFPVIRKTLWFASKKTGNLGKMPVTYLFSFACFSKSKENVQNSLSSFFVNKVFYVYSTVQCYSVDNLDTRKIQRFCVFANTRVSLFDSRFTAENLKLFNNPRVDSLFIERMNIEFNSVVKFKNYLGSLILFDPLPNDWENILFKSETQFGYLCLPEAKIVYYESMQNFVNRQPSNFVWCIHDIGTIDNQEFFKYFKQCDLKNHGVPHLVHYTVTAGKMIHFCSVISTTTKNETSDKSTFVAH